MSRFICLIFFLCILLNPLISFAGSVDSETAESLAISAAQSFASSVVGSSDDISSASENVIHVQPGVFFDYYILSGTTWSIHTYTNNTGFPGWAPTVSANTWRAGAWRQTVMWPETFFEYDLSFGLQDQDGDGIDDEVDNCLSVSNPDQLDTDSDGLGDLCDNDIDNDGMDNDIDPYPLEVFSFEYKLLEYQKDTEGVYTFVKIQTDKGDIFEYGEAVEDTIHYLTIGAVYEDSSSLETYLISTGLVDTSYIGGGSTSSEFDSVDTGIGETGGVTDAEKWGNIESNTSTIADNQQLISDGLMTIADGLLDQAGQLAERDALEESVRSGTEAGLDAIGQSDYTPYDVSDVPSYADDQTDYENELTNLNENSGISALRDSLGIETSGGSPVLSCSLFGHTITFDFSAHSSVLSSMGNMWVSLCYLSGFFIIMRS